MSINEILGMLFQPALPMRGVTQIKKLFRHCGCYFNPHSPCGE